MKQRTIDFRFAPDIQQTCICQVDDPIKTIVREDGSLNYLWHSDKNQFVSGTARPCYKRVLDVQEGNIGFKYRCLPRFYHRDKLLSRHQDFGAPGAAIVETIEEYERSTFHWKTFGHRLPSGVRLDVILFELTAKENFGHACESIYLQTLGAPYDPPETQRIISDAFMLHTGKSETPAPVVHASEIRSNDEVMKPGTSVLHSNEVWRGAFALVYTGRLEPDAFTLDFANQCLVDCQNYWLNVKPFIKAFQIPDKQIQRLIEICGRNILQAREIVDGIHEFHVGPTIYRGLWVVDGYYFAECGYMMGRDDEAWEGLLAVLKRVKPDGSIRILRDHFKETAVAISSIVRQCELRNNDTHLCELWPMIMRALDHLITMRDETFTMGDDYPARGLFKPAFGDGGIYGPEPEYTTPMNVLVGVRDAARAGKRLGLDGWKKCEEFASELDEALSMCIQRDMHKTPEGLPYLPLSMATNPAYKPQTGIQTIARVAFHGAFKLDDPLLKATEDLAESVSLHQGLPECTGWRSDQSIYVYAAGRFGELALLTGRPEQAANYLYAFANHAAPSGVWREEQPLADTPCAEICGDMPHNWAAVEFIRLVRTLLLLEWEGGVTLLPGMPKEWLPTKGNDLYLEETPTAFGKVTMLMRKVENGYELQIQRKTGNQELAYFALCWSGQAFINSKLLEAAKGGYWKLPLDAGTFTVELT